MICGLEEVKSESKSLEKDVFGLCVGVGRRERWTGPDEDSGGLNSEGLGLTSEGLGLNYEGFGLNSEGLGLNYESFGLNSEKAFGPNKRQKRVRD